MKGIIRKCTVKDLNDLQSISIETFSDTFASQNDATDLEEYVAKAFTLEKLEDELKNPDSHFFFMYIADELAGYLKLNMAVAQTEKINRNGLEIERIYIRSAFKRHGLGRQLINFAQKYANKEKCQVIWLGVWEKNQPALDFYQSLGFKQIQKHDFYVGSDRQTDLILVKSFVE